VRKTKIVSDSGVLNGEPHVEGTRVSAWKIHDMHTTLDMSPKEIVEELPTVDLEGATAAIEYVNEREKTGLPLEA